MRNKRTREEEGGSIDIDISALSTQMTYGEILSNKKKEMFYSLKFEDHSVPIKTQGNFKKVKNNKKLDVSLIEVNTGVEKNLGSFLAKQATTTECIFDVKLNFTTMKLEEDENIHGFNRKRLKLKFTFLDQEILSEQFVILKEQQYQKIIDLSSKDVSNNIKLLGIDTPVVSFHGADFMKLRFTSSFKKMAVEQSKFTIRVNGNYVQIFSMISDFSKRKIHEGFLMFETPTLQNGKYQIFEVFYNNIRLMFEKNKVAEPYEILSATQ
eukprot:gene1262-11349_t